MTVPLLTAKQSSAVTLNMEKPLETFSYFIETFLTLLLLQVVFASRFSLNSFILTRKVATIVAKRKKTPRN